MEFNIGYAGSLPGAASCHSSSAHQPRHKTKCPKHWHTGHLRHTYISLLIIPCMIVYVTNKQEPWTLNLVNAEDLVKLLNPLKTATTEKKRPTVSLIVPLKNMIEQSMVPNDGDSPTVTDTKRAILSNVSGRYSGDAYNYLLESTALDPRF